MQGPVSVSDHEEPKLKTSLLILVIFLMQILAPTISADGPSQPKIVVQNNEHYSLMEGWSDT